MHVPVHMLIHVCACDGENMEVFYRQKCVSLNDHLRVREETSTLLPMLLHVSVSLTRVNVLECVSCEETPRCLT